MEANFNQRPLSTTPMTVKNLNRLRKTSVDHSNTTSLVKSNHIQRQTEHTPSFDDRSAFVHLEFSEENSSPRPVLPFLMDEVSEKKLIKELDEMHVVIMEQYASMKKDQDEWRERLEQDDPPKEETSNQHRRGRPKKVEGGGVILFIVKLYR